MRISDIAIIAEVVDPGYGFMSEDFFLLLLGWAGDAFMAPMASRGTTELQLYFEERCGQRLSGKLAGTVEFASNIMWPPEVAGQALYRIIPPPYRKGLWGRLARLREICLRTIYYDLTPKVVEYLKTRSNSYLLINLPDPEKMFFERSDDDPGSITIQDGVVYYRGGSFDNWHMRISDIAIIAEITDPLFGLRRDNYSLTLLFLKSAEDGFMAPMASKGMTELLVYFEERSGQHLSGKLAGTLEFASNIMWPPELAGQALYRIISPPCKYKKGLWGRLVRLREIRVRTRAIDRIELTPEAAEYLNMSPDSSLQTPQSSNEKDG